MNFNWFQMFSPARRAATSCSLRSFCASSSPLPPFTSNASTAAFSFSASSHSTYASPVPCKFLHSLNSRILSPLNSTFTLSTSVRRRMGSNAPEEMTFCFEGEESLEEETKAEKKRKAQLAQVWIPKVNRLKLLLSSSYVSQHFWGKPHYSWGFMGPMNIFFLNPLS